MLKQGLFAFFLPELENRYKPEDLEENMKLKIIFIISLSWLSIYIVFIGLRFWYLEKLNFNISILLLMVIGFASLLFYLRSTLNVKKSARFLSLLLFIFIPLRVLITGGINSTGIYLYSAHVLATFAIYNKKKGSLVFLYSIVSIMFFAMLDRFQVLPKTPFYTSPVNEAITVILLSLMILMPCLLIINQSEQYSSQLNRIERKKISYLLLAEVRKKNIPRLKMGVKQIDTAIRLKNATALGDIEAVLLDIDQSMKTMSKAVDEKTPPQEND